MGKYTLAILLIISIGLAACIRNPATRKVHARLLSPEAERRIGEETKKKILEQYAVIKSTTVNTYVNRIGQKIATLSDRPTVDFEFTVLDSDLINAFAAPGGFIFVTRGLLEAMNDEAELAMVLGHEIAHVTALHGVQMIQKEMGQNALTILGTIGAALVAGPEAMIMIGKTSTLFSSLYLLGYSREKELEADNLGLQYMLRAGYDPQASLRFLQELKKGDEKKVGGWDLYFRTHPSTDERIDIIQHMIGQGEKDATTSYEAEFEKIKAHLPKVDPSERGEIEGQTYKNRLHSLTLTVPSNWKLGYFNSQSLISFHTEDQNGQGQLQVIVSSKPLDAEQIVRRYIRLSGSQFLRGRSVLYRAGYGYLGRYIGLSARGKPLEYRIFCTVRRKRGYMLICGGPAGKIESYILDIEQIMRNFEFTA